MSHAEKETDHDRGDNTDNANAYCCVVCEQYYTTPSDLKHHMLTHAQVALSTGTGETVNDMEDNDIDRGPRIGVDELGKTLQDQADDTEQICSVCSKIFVNARHLQQHMVIHGGSLSHHNSDTTPTCPNQANNKANISSRTPSITCSHCQIHFTKPSQLKRHMIIRHGVNPHICSTCGKGFQFSVSLYQHMLTHIDDDKPQ
jgi:hypothetical protein